MDGKPLEGIVVVALEQGVAAPYCSSRLADAGARVIKIEPPEGDCARRYDKTVNGESSYFVWINRGKESVALDLHGAAGRATLAALIAGADVFIQNLAPGVAARLGAGSDILRARHARLITCDVSGYGDAGPLHRLKANDPIVQAESGLVAVNGAAGPWGRVGVAICAITAGMNALVGVQQALLQRARTGRGSAIKVSLFDSAAELMSVPYLQTRYGRCQPARAGLCHPAIAPDGAFMCGDGREFVLSIRNETEWTAFCAAVLRRPALASDPRFHDNDARRRNREALDTLIQDVFGALSWPEAVDLLTEAQTPHGAINSVHDLIDHPQLRTREMKVNGRTVKLPAPPCVAEWDDAVFRPAPMLDEHAALDAAAARV